MEEQVIALVKAGITHARSSRKQYTIKSIGQKMYNAARKAESEEAQQKAIASMIRTLGLGTRKGDGNGGINENANETRDHRG